MPAFSGCHECGAVNVAASSKAIPQEAALDAAKSDILQLPEHGAAKFDNGNGKSDTMALKATIFKADLQIADMDRHYYQEHGLTIARHPSETDERMMVRVLAFARHAHQALCFGKGLSDVEEPDLWQKDLTGAIDLWIEAGQPDEKRILKACGRAAQVVIYSYSSNSSIWWDQIGSKVERARNLTVINVQPAASLALAKLAQRTMQLQCTIQDGQIWVNGNGETVQVDLTMVKIPAPSLR